MRRIITIVIALALILGAVPAQAFAWCNGPTKNGSVGSGYGSHDWILDRAITKAGASGAWVRRTTALLASDDPDTQKWAAATQHIFATGSCRGAAQAVSDLYHQAVVAYAAGDRVAASRYLGQLSHCYSDILQPFHTSSVANGYRALHTKYEYAVDDHQSTRTNSFFRITSRPAAPVDNVRTMTIDAATFARGLFPSLLSSYKASHSVTKGTPLKVTKAVMSRAVNDLADIIAGIPAGTGEASQPGAVDLSLNRTNVRPNSRVGASIHVTDAAGDPIDAVGVKLIWHLAGGSVVYHSYTDGNGDLSEWQDIGDAKNGQALSVDALVTVNGRTTTATCAFTATQR
jgi:hypothetical protein